VGDFLTLLAVLGVTTGVVVPDVPKHIPTNRSVKSISDDEDPPPHAISLRELLPTKEGVCVIIGTLLLSTVLACCDGVEGHSENIDDGSNGRCRKESLPPPRAPGSSYSPLSASSSSSPASSSSGRDRTSSSSIVMSRIEPFKFHGCDNEETRESSLLQTSIDSSVT
jgi:hypothetical protein